MKKGGRELLTTQCYVRGDAGNERDQIWKTIADPRARDAVTIPFTAVAGSAAGELMATFDIVLGLTPPA